jgi:uncharacterized membrane protein
MALIISVNPTSLAFGTVTAGQTSTLALVITNTDSANTVALYSVTSSNPDFVPDAIPDDTEIAPLGSYTCNVTWTAPTYGAAEWLIGNAYTVGNQVWDPADGVTYACIANNTGEEPSSSPTYWTAVVDSGTVTITMNPLVGNSPYNVAATGTSVVATTASISISPPSYVFPPAKANTNSATVTFTVTNTGTGNVTVQIPVVTVPFYGTGLPSGPTVLAPGGTLTFGIYFNPTSGGYVVESQGLAVTSGAASSPNYADLEGMGTLITPAYIVTGGTENGFAAFGSTLLQFDSTDFDCEETAYAEREISPTGPGYETVLTRLGLQYEDQGQAVVTVLATSDGRAQSEQQVKIGTPEATGKVKKSSLADLKHTGEVITLRMTANGPLWLDGYFPRWEEGGEVKK